MKKATSVRLSLRKLFIAMLAVGPISILPSPLLAVLPANIGATAAPFIVTNGTATWTNGVNVGTVSASDRSVLVWANGAFKIDSGDTFSFQVPGGAVLNKVGYQTNALAGAVGSLATPDNAIINGQLISSGRVLVLANGNIQVGAGASISTTGGLVLSTLSEPVDFTFTTTGNLGLTGASLGAITIGSGASLVNLISSVTAASESVSLNNITVTGDLVINQRAGLLVPTINLSGATGTTTVQGALTVNSTTAPVTQLGGNLIVSNGITSITTGVGAGVGLPITLATAGNDFNTVRVTTTGTSGLVALADTNSIILSNSTVGGLVGGPTSLNVLAVGGISTVGTVASIGNVTLTGSGDVTFGNNSTVGDTLGAVSSGGNVAISTLGALKTGILTAGGAGGVSVTSTGLTSLNGAITGPSATITAPSINSASLTPLLGITTTGITTLNATAGSVILPSLSVPRANVTATGGSISQGTGTTAVFAIGGGESNFNASSGGITLANANNSINNNTLNLIGSSVTVNSTTGLTIGNANVTGSVAIDTTAAVLANTGAVVLGTNSGTLSQAITIGGGLSIRTNGSSITDDDDLNATIFGPLNLATNAGAIVAGALIELNSSVGASGRGIASYGQINAASGAAAITVHERQTVNLGAVSTTGALTVNSVAGGILFAGTTNVGSLTANAAAANTTITQTSGITVTGTSNIRGTTSVIPGIILDNTANSFGGAVTVSNGGIATLVSGTALTMAGGTTSNATNNTLSVRTTTGDVSIAGGNVIDYRVDAAGKINFTGNNTGFRNLTLTAGDSSATAINQPGANPLTGAFLAGSWQSVNGTLTLSTPGSVKLDSIVNNLTTLTLNGVAGTAAVATTRSLTVNGNSPGPLVVTAGTGAIPTAATVTSFPNAWTLTFGNLNVGSLTANVGNGSGIGGLPTLHNGTTVPTNTLSNGISGTISQSTGTNIHVENTIDAITYGGGIVLGNNGNSFGRIQLATGGTSGTAGVVGVTGDITLVEDTTAKIGNVATLGNASLTSRLGGIIEDSTSNVNLTVNGSNSGLTLAAPNGSILLGNTTHTAGVTSSNVTSATIQASGAAALQSTGNLVLGATSANSLNITANSITQSAPLSIFGLASFSTNTGSASGGISLTNAENNFGPLALTVTTGNQSIAVTENATLNLRSVSMVGLGNGTFTARSMNGDIVDTGLSGVKLGGNVTNAGSGVVTLAAPNGNIALDDPTSDVLTSSGIAFSGQNVTISVLGGTGSILALGAAGTPSVATGNLTVSTALGNIGNAGPMSVSGTAFFQAPGGNISIAQPGVGFGTVRFIGNQVSIAEAGNMDVLTGSSSFGPAQLVSGGSISIVDAGGGPVTFGSTVAMQATGNITLRLVQAVGQVSVNASGTKDLSALSLSGDLNNIIPNDLGTGPGPSLVPQPVPPLAPKP